MASYEYRNGKYFVDGKEVRKGDSDYDAVVAHFKNKRQRVGQSVERGNVQYIREGEDTGVEFDIRDIREIERNIAAQNTPNKKPSRVDKFGLPTNLPRTPGELSDIQNALVDVESYKSQGAADGFSPGEIEEFSNSFVKNKVVDGLKNRVAQSQSPNSPAEPGATLESEAIHVTSVKDVRLEEKYQEKIPLMKPDDTVASATKAMQTNIDNVTKKINKIMESFGSYADMASIGAGSKNIDNMIESAASVNAKYMKVMTNKMME